MAAPPVHVSVGSHDVRVTHPERVYYPKTGTTKAAVLEYYARVAPVLLPHLRDQPVILKRFPEGVEAKSFYQRTCPNPRPEWVETVRVRHQEESSPVEYCLVQNLATIVWLANLGTLELHRLGFQADAPREARGLVFDMDPGPGAGLPDACFVALEIRDWLRSEGLVPGTKVSGGKGLHVHARLDPPAPFEDVRDYARGVASGLARTIPRTVTDNMRKDRRRGRVLIDWSQNSSHKATVAAYSLRGRSTPAVAAPVTWREVEEGASGDAASLRFGPEETLERIETEGDLLHDMLREGRRLPR